MVRHIFQSGWCHYSRATNGKRCPILLILQTPVHVTSIFYLHGKKYAWARFEDLEELEDAVFEQVQMYERGCLTTEYKNCRVGGGRCPNTNDITLKDFSKVSLVFQINTHLESSLHYFFDDPRIFFSAGSWQIEVVIQRSPSAICNSTV